MAGYILVPWGASYFLGAIPMMAHGTRAPQDLQVLPVLLGLGVIFAGLGIWLLVLGRRPVSLR